MDFLFADYYITLGKFSDTFIFKNVVNSQALILKHWINKKLTGHIIHMSNSFFTILVVDKYASCKILLILVAYL